MKLWITNKYFERLKSGEKSIDWRAAHITFINEDTKESMKFKVDAVVVADKVDDKKFILNSVDEEDFRFFEDDEKVLGFVLKKEDKNG
jgi:hypothetical protein